MGDNSLINIGNLSKPAAVLIEKISDAIGVLWEPYQIKRIAKAEAEAEKIRALTKIEIRELQQRALVRFVGEETRKQINIESITVKAIKNLNNNANPNAIENDWIANFFDKCKLISDNEMQELWAKVLSGEANTPGTYSKRTVNFLHSLDKSDALLFTNLCSYCWMIGGIVPLIYEVQDNIYTQKGINFGSLKHLDDIGLVSFGNLAGYKRMGFPEKVTVFYYGKPINIQFNKKENNEMNIGKVLLSKIGQELAPIVGSKPIDEFLDYVLKKWVDMGFIIYSDLPKKSI
jgi:hypothetical protein